MSVRSPLAPTNPRIMSGQTADDIGQGGEEFTIFKNTQAETLAPYLMNVNLTFRKKRTTG
jgi:hypothetical protein